MIEFKNLELSDRDVFKKYHAGFYCPHSQYNFSNLFMWRDMIKTKYAVEDGFLCVAGEIKGAPVAMFPVGEGKVCGVIDNLFDHFGANLRLVVLTDDMLSRVDECMPGRFAYNEYRASFDYVYKTESLINLSGKALHAKRNHINKFKSLYNYEYHSLTRQLLPYCAELEDKWLAGKSDFGGTEREYERKAIMSIIENFTYLDCRGGLIMVDGKPAAFSIGEMMNDDTALIHIEKADTAYEGVYSAINQMTCRQEFSNAEYINREEDMGLESLRKAKLSYKPHRLTRVWGLTMK